MEEMVFKNLISKLKTACQKFYRPPIMDDALRRREILSIFYAASAVCFFISCLYRIRQLEGEQSSMKVKPSQTEGDYSLDIASEILLELAPPIEKGE